MADVSDDMSYLFLKAAEHYPLKAKPEWNNVSRELKMFLQIKRNERRCKRILVVTILLMLLPLKS